MTSSQPGNMLQAEEAETAKPEGGGGWKEDRVVGGQARKRWSLEVGKAGSGLDFNLRGGKPPEGFQQSGLILKQGTGRGCVET